MEDDHDKQLELLVGKYYCLLPNEVATSALHRLEELSDSKYRTDNNIVSLKVEPYDGGVPEINSLGSVVVGRNNYGRSDMSRFALRNDVLRIYDCGEKPGFEWVDDMGIDSSEKENVVKIIYVLVDTLRKYKVTFAAEKKIELENSEDQ